MANILRNRKNRRGLIILNDDSNFIIVLFVLFRKIKKSKTIKFANIITSATVIIKQYPRRVERLP